MKDYKLSEVRNICKKYADKDCIDCPIYDFCSYEIAEPPYEWKIEEQKIIED